MMMMQSLLSITLISITADIVYSQQGDISEHQGHQICGGRLKGPVGIIQTPNFPNPFPVPIKCKWIIEHDIVNGTISIYFTQQYTTSGLTFTEYLYYDESYKLGERKALTVTEENITRNNWLQGQKDAPVEILSDEENFSLTGYFNDRRKRIDIVLVFKDDGSDVLQQTRLNFLMNVIQFGLEAEVESGKMPEHRNLIFVKLHAPDLIIEEFGVYFNEKSLFKDSHLEFINPIFNIFGVPNERELIKVVRNQYPGPDNYSTLERSNIVYKILLQLPFGKYKNQFGINKLMDNFIIQDAFALHDGPYFIVPKQKLAHINARQVLFVEWLGMINVWKMQPIHMIHEYFGNRISYYFAFYEYFNLMLIIPSIVGFCTMVSLYAYSSELGPYEWIQNGPCNPSPKNDFMCPECRNYTLCPILKKSAYCEELLFLASIDKQTTQRFGYFIAIWGIIFLILWRPRERYLTWIWEETKRYTNKLVRTEYQEHEIKTDKEKEAQRIKKRNNPGRLLKIFIYLLTAVCFGLWAMLIFRFSIIIWHYPRWRRLHGNREHYVYKHGERENIAVGAAIYTIIVWLLKMVFMVLVQKLTGWENNETFLIYDRSIALKMYAFSFIGSFLILITYTFLGSIFIYLPSYDIEQFYHMMYGYAMMNSGQGSTFDDIYITLFIITILEHVILKVPGLLMKDKTDYPVGFNSGTPCWEREYKLKPITEFFFYKRYNALAIQFALVTCYSMMFPMASLFLFIINIWDLRHAARQLLLEYRRPLLINTSGPGFWKYLIFITAFYAPMSNTAIIVFQSDEFARKHFAEGTRYYVADFYYNIKYQFKKVKVAVKEYERMRSWMWKYHTIPNNCIERHLIDFKERVVPALKIELTIRYIVLMTLSGVVLGFFLFYVIPKTSNSLEDAIKEEQKIKNKYQTTQRNTRILKGRINN